MVDNQHRKIKGYAELTEEELALINEIKETGEVLAALIAKVRALPYDSSVAIPARTANWIYEAEYTLKKGIMYLVRAVAHPTGF